MEFYLVLSKEHNPRTKRTFKKLQIPRKEHTIHNSVLKIPCILSHPLSSHILGSLLLLLYMALEKFSSNPSALVLLSHLFWSQFLL